MEDIGKKILQHAGISIFFLPRLLNLLVCVAGSRGWEEGEKRGGGGERREESARRASTVVSIHVS